MIKISKDKKGTHTIQSLLDVITMPEEEELIALDIVDHVFELASVTWILIIGVTSNSCCTKSIIDFLT